MKFSNLIAPTYKSDTFQLRSREISKELFNNYSEGNEEDNGDKELYLETEGNVY